MGAGSSARRKAKNARGAAAAAAADDAADVATPAGTPPPLQKSKGSKTGSFFHHHVRKARTANGGKARLFELMHKPPASPLALETAREHVRDILFSLHLTGSAAAADPPPLENKIEMGSCILYPKQGMLVNRDEAQLDRIMVSNHKSRKTWDMHYVCEGDIAPEEDSEEEENEGEQKQGSAQPSSAVERRSSSGSGDHAGSRRSSAEKVEAGEGKEDEDIQVNFGSSVYFQAPEMWLKVSAAQFRKFEGWAIDVWAVGVALFIMVYGTLPFKNKAQLQRYVLEFEPFPTPAELFADMGESAPEDGGDGDGGEHDELHLYEPEACEVPFPTSPCEADLLLKPLLRRMLHPDPLARPALQEVISSDWISDIVDGFDEGADDEEEAEEPGYWLEDDLEFASAQEAKTADVVADEPSDAQGAAAPTSPHSHSHSGRRRRRGKGKGKGGLSEGEWLLQKAQRLHVCEARVRAQRRERRNRAARLAAAAAGAAAAVASEAAHDFERTFPEKMAEGFARWAKDTAFWAAEEVAAQCLKLDDYIERRRLEILANLREQRRLGRIKWQSSAEGKEASMRQHRREQYQGMLVRKRQYQMMFERLGAAQQPPMKPPYRVDLKVVKETYDQYCGRLGSGIGVGTKVEQMLVAEGAGVRIPTTGQRLVTWEEVRTALWAQEKEVGPAGP
eukprot:g2052.t1